MMTERIERVLRGMREEKLDCILVSAPASVYYLTGEWVEPGERMLALLLKSDGSARLFANRLFALPGKMDMPLSEYDDTEDCVALLAGYLPAGVVGVDKTWAARFLLPLMRMRADIRFAVGSAPVDRARMCKDERELEALRASSRANDRAVERLIASLREGQTERQAARRYEEEAERLGADGTSFAPLICFGANCAEPHHASDHTVLKRGDAVIMDVGLDMGHGLSDITRTVFWGKATDEQKRVYELVRRANAAGKAAVRPGTRLMDVDRAARAVIEDGGYGKYFIHRTGHGIGLEVHEPPDVSATATDELRPGMVFSVEPGIYLPGQFGVRIEDLVAVTEDGCEVLNNLTRDLIELN